MNRTMIHNLVDRIVAEVVRRVEEEMLRQQHPERVVVLTGSRPVYPEKLESWLSERYGQAYVRLRFGEPPEPPPDRLKLAETVGTAETVILAAPDITTLQRIASGEDGDSLAGAVVRAILWKKNVRILLDYEPPKFRRNTFYESIAGALETLRSMGVTVEYYRTFQPEEVRLELVTEAAVLAAAETADKTILCVPNPVITPAAKDAIRETGVLLNYKEGGS